MTKIQSELRAASGIPTEVTTFIGRRQERSDVRAMLADSRLVTLTGPGGVGKTRLATQLASELRRAFPDGVAFVPLSTLNHPEWLAQTVAGSLGLQSRSTKVVLASLVEYLSSREVLLILDNCEHLVETVAVFTDTLLRTCLRLRILATSREPLRIQGEIVHTVPPLTVPPQDDRLGDPLLHFEAVALFVDRARRLAPDFEVSGDNRASVVELCRKLEGIPLAIELATGRLSAMTPAELCTQLTDRWELLNRGSRTAPDRQRTMAACIEWSFQLCSEHERALWARASVCAGSFEFEDAKAVCAGPPFDAHDFIDVLSGLVDKSVITTERGERTSFRMLPPIRERGLAELRALGQLTEVRRHHRDWYAKLARQARLDWISPHQVAWFGRLRREQPNLRAALEFCTDEPGEAEPGLQICADLQDFTAAEGLLRPGRQWTERLLARSSEPTEARALALRSACWLATLQGDLAHAGSLLDEGRELADALGEPIRSLFKQTGAFVALFSGDATEAATPDRSQLT